MSLRTQGSADVFRPSSALRVLKASRGSCVQGLPARLSDMGCAQSGAPGGSTRSAASVVPANVDASKYYKASAALPTAANSVSQCGDSVCSQEGFDHELRAWWPLSKKEIVEKYLELRPGAKYGWRAMPAGPSRSLIASRNVSRRHRRVHQAGGRTHGLLCGGLPGRCAAGRSRSGRI